MVPTSARNVRAGAGSYRTNRSFSTVPNFRLKVPEHSKCRDIYEKELTHLSLTDVSPKLEQPDQGDCDPWS